MSNQSEAQAFRQRIIASEIENLPTGLLELLETAETLASKLVSTQNKLLEEEQKRVIPARPPKTHQTQEQSKAAA